jgi:hypothetical protein
MAAEVNRRVESRVRVFIVELGSLREGKIKISHFRPAREGKLEVAAISHCAVRLPLQLPSWKHEGLLAMDGGGELAPEGKSPGRALSSEQISVVPHPVPVVVVAVVEARASIGESREVCVDANLFQVVESPPH